MEDWFKATGRPALFEALANVCDQIDSEIDTSFKSYTDENARLATELARAKIRAAEADRMEEENQSLKGELKKLKNTSHANTSHIDQSKPFNGTRTPLAPRSANQVLSTRRSAKSGDLDLDGLKISELKEEYSKLKGNFTKLHGKYLELEDAHKELNRRLRMATNGYKQWKDHANQVHEISEKRSQTIKRLKAKLAAAAAAAYGPLDASFSSDTPARPMSKQQTAGPGFIEFDVPTELGSERPSPVPESHSAWHVGETHTLPPLPQNRDLGADTVPVKNEPSSDTPMVVSERWLRKRKHDNDPIDAPRAPAIKTEDGSDPLITNERHPFEPQESIDLDAEGGIVYTPRKRNRPNPQPEDEFAPDSPETSQLETNDTQPVGPSRPSARPRPEENAENLEEPQPSERDIDSLQQQVPKPPTRGKARTGRLQTLLNTPSSGYEAVPLTLYAQSHDTPTTRVSEQKRGLPFTKDEASKSNKAPQSRGTSKAPKKQTPGKSVFQRSTERTTNSTPDGTKPLRERPKSELYITDFKVNPDANDGVNFAFTEVVRNKDERANLTGCVQENCCGQVFRVQARGMRARTSPSDFQALLGRYLGDEAWKLPTMSEAEKEDLWVEAKTQELSNEHSRHRHRYHRAPSPAGYWRMHFPSTQEELQDKEEAAKRTRQMVEERYREAMRPGGRWLFRDE
ncbi:SAE2-domain-containing protein [Hypoxylon sp. FL1284]|nr:SAE2-domain-containing protein [Hypoxylon sp. FL1284]